MAEVVEVHQELPACIWPVQDLVDGDPSLLLGGTSGPEAGLLLALARWALFDAGGTGGGGAWRGGERCRGWNGSGHGGGVEAPGNG